MIALLLRILAVIGIGVVVLAAAAAGLLGYFIYTPDAAPPSLSGSWRQGAIESGGFERSYRLYTPAELPPGAPLVLVLHSSDGDATQIRQATGYGFERLADRRGFAVAYPQGLEGNWNGCNRVGDYRANQLDVDDVGFLIRLVDELANTQAINAERVFVVGLSRGGHMAYRLALEAPTRFRAVAAVAANLPTSDNFKCEPTAGTPPSVMIMNGTEDPLNPFDGGEVRLLGLFNRGTVISAAATAQYFADLAGAGGPERTREAFGRVRVEHTRWRAGIATEVQLSAVRGGGHVMPQAHWRSPRILGHTPREVDGPAEIWSFFERQPQAAGEGGSDAASADQRTN